jgi:hypothetical protein
MEVCIAGSGKIERHGLKTDEKGQLVLAGFLRKSGVAGYEVCGYENRLTRFGRALQKEVGCVVVPLNPGNLRIIRESRKKTDKTETSFPRTL